MAPKLPVLTYSVFSLWALAFCMWAVVLGGLASLQDVCQDNPKLGFINAGNLSGTRGFSATQLPCYAVHRYYWWIVSFQFALLVGLGMALMAGCVSSMRATWVGLFAVASALACQMTDSYLALEGVAFYQQDQPLHRARAMGAGCVAICILNLLLVAAIGSDFDGCKGCTAKAAAGSTTGGRAKEAA